MAKLIGLPRLSPTMEEGTLTRWVKHEGDDVAVDDLIAEVETDKATMEWRSFDRGVLLKTLAEEGATLAPDAPVAIIGERGEDFSELLARATGGQKSPGAAASEADEQAQPPPPSAKPAPAASEADEQAQPPPRSAKPAPADADAEANPPPTASAEPAPQPGEADAAAPPPPAAGEPATATPSVDPTRILASPSVRRLARDQGVDLKQLRGSGPRGRIVQRDIEELAKKSADAKKSDAKSSDAKPSQAEPAQAKQAQAKQAQAKQAGLPQSAPGQRSPPQMKPLSATRRTIARRLTEAKATIPHYYLTIDVDAEPLQRARSELNHGVESDDERVSLNDLLIKACAAALRENPALNVSFMGEDLAIHQVVDIAVAVAVTDGLLTPVVRDADKKGVVAIAREVRQLAELARARKLTPEQMADATFTISNLGMFGIEAFTAVINPPQAAILAVGAIRDEPVVRDAGLSPGKRMRLTLSCDHRAIDGAVGAEWLRTLRTILEHPMRMLR